MNITPKIYRFADGGKYDDRFTVFEPIGTPSFDSRGSGGKKASKAKDDDSGELSQKDFFNMIKDIDGLPMEMLSIVKSLQDNLRLLNLTGINQDNIAVSYINNLYKIKIAADNKKKFNEAKLAAEQNGAWGEPAIAMNGNLVAQDAETGDLTSVDLLSYMQNPNAYKILTVAQLGYLREWDPRLNGDLEAFNIMRNSMGYEAFLKLLKDAVGSLGKDTSVYNGLITNEGEASKGLDILKKLTPLDKEKISLSTSVLEGLYNYKIQDSTLMGLIEALADYLVSALPLRARTWAVLKTGNPNSQLALKDFVLSSLISGNNRYHSLDISYKGSIDKVTGNNQKAKNEEKATFLTNLQMGVGSEIETRTFTPGGQASFKVEGTAYGSFIDTSGKTVSDLTLQELLNKTGIAGITSSSSIMFGNTLLSPNLLSSVAVENNGGFYAILPCKKEGGIIVPDFELVDAYEKAVLDANKNIGPNTTYELRLALILQEVAKVPELQELLDMSGNLDFNKVCPFFIVDGIASDISVEFGDINSRSLMALTDDKNDLNYYLKVTGLENEFKDSFWNDIVPWADNTRVYKSNIFIPIKTNNRLAAIISSGLKLNDSVARQIEGEYQQARVMSDMHSNDPRLLFMQ